MQGPLEKVSFVYSLWVSIGSQGWLLELRKDISDSMYLERITGTSGMGSC